jgi:uncharacterized protein YndB with AHSA1/START domain
MQKVLLGVVGVIIAVVLVGVIVLLALGRRDDAGRNTAAIQIDRPPAQVFPWITEPDRLKQWIGGLVESTPLTDDGLEVGARSREVIAMGNERYEMETTIVDLEPPVRLVVEIESSGFKADARYDLVESGGGTFFSYACISRYEHPMAKLMEPLVTRAAQQKIEGDLARLKELVESSPWGGS